MAHRQMYDDVLGVALRQTLKEHGFSRKTKRDYVQERAGRAWYFEVEMERRLGAGFLADAAVFIPELDDTLERFVPGFYGVHAPTHNKSNVVAPILRLIELEHGRRYSVNSQPNYPEEGFDSAQKLRGDQIFYYLEDDHWVIPRYTDRLGRSDEERKTDWERGARELGLFLDEQWRALAWDWYHKCDDPLFVVHWIETEDPGGIGSDCSRAVLCHMAGETGRARFYLQRRVEEASITYETLYREIHDDKRGNWLRRFWEGGMGWSEEEVAKLTKGRLRILSETAGAARKLATGFGIRLD